MGRSVVCLGAAAMDLIIKVPKFPSSDEMVFACEEPSFLPGGSTANIATGLSRLGIPTRFVGKVGKDQAGEALRTAFEDEYVDVRWLMAKEGGRTAQTVIPVDPSGSRVIYSLGGTALLEAPDEFEEAIMADAGLLYVGEAFPEVADKAMSAARARGAVIVYGPGGCIAWIDRDTLVGLITAADYVFVSRTELNAVTSCSTYEHGVDLLLAWGAKNVVVTLGKDGSLCCGESTAGTFVHTGSFSVNAVDTTGAGDAFAAGFMSGLASGCSTAECLVRGNACAAIAIGKVGARQALPRWQELREFIDAHNDELGDKK